VVLENRSNTITLSPYMEVIGPFVDLVEQDDALLAEIANHIVVLPIELKEALTPHVGRRIAILRTDIPGKEYLFRVVQSRETEQTTTQFRCQDEQISNCVEAFGINLSQDKITNAV